MPVTGSGDDSERFLKYLDLPDDYEPSPTRAPLDFLRAHLYQLPQHLAVYFSSSVAPRERTALPIVRNRRLNYAQSPAGSTALGYSAGRAEWPLLWEQSGSTRDDVKPGELSGQDERAWANANFMGGQGGELGRLGGLLSEYEAEREAERMRALRRDRAVRESMMPQVEEEEDESDEEDDATDANAAAEEESVEEHRAAFERLLRERFVYGTLDDFDYDSVDWNDEWDSIAERDNEERWFDADDDDDMVVDIDRSGTPDY
ncbi:hypothetical protein EXIGLDRAFT_753970 [Exidia glandulosa HHB12029]|uniref:CCD97-like C-terminal domain-containing protein n=1 Tax=Exidia glandulosa HHB12029 TaxID=1314781 RepID=A0A165DD50_EXIGL|nr:hypothetical protein EXIGLDRAFT_753970 [Exidia glandulosa HHB12029]